MNKNHNDNRFNDEEIGFDVLKDWSMGKRKLFFSVCPYEIIRAMKISGAPDVSKKKFVERSGLEATD